MKYKFLSLMAVLILSLSLAACGGSDTDNKEPAKEESTIDETEATEEAVIKAREPGETPFDYPTVTTDAQAGEHVFAVTEEDLNEAFKAKAKDESMYLSFYEGTMVTPGDVESVVEISGEKNSVPNSLIIPVAPGQSAEKGEVVLTAWIGTMTRGYVKTAGTTPKVVQIDMFQDVETLKEDSFSVLKEDWQPGTKIACTNDSGDYSLKTVINISGDKILTSAWADTVEIHEKSNCKPVPRVPEAGVGDKVWIAPVDTLQEGTVTEVDSEDGILTVEYEWVDTEEEKFPFGDVLTEAP